MSNQVPIQVYDCPVHGEFEVKVPFSQGVLQWSLCPFMKKHDHERCHEVPCKYECMISSKHVIKPVAAAYVKGGGTGAGRGRR